MWQVFAAIQLLMLSAFAVGVVFTAVTIWNLSSILPEQGVIGDLKAAESSHIYSADGQLLATLFMDEHREYVPLSKVPKDLLHATVATEDKRFYDHNGVDFRGIARAVVEDVRSQARSQGGSTITQQLVRNVYLTQRKSVGRKIQEALLALQIERKYSKDQILEKYLNQVFYGSGAYGVQAAAETYFGKKVSKLSLSECALVAGLPQRPTGYSPYKSMKLAKMRRDTVLALMKQEGYITEAQKENAQKAPIKLGFRRASGARVRRAPYFIDYILDDLVDRYGANTVYKGGLKITTTLLTPMQAVADKAVRDGVANLSDQHVSQGALVSLDPRTGYIRAMVGGTDYHKSQLNRANLNKHPRSPGSSFKPFVYAAAFENGVSPYDTVSDEPISIDDGGRRPWRPSNYDNKWYGSITIRTAIAQSRNIPAIKTIQKIGVDKAIEMAHRLGIESQLGHNLSLAIGTSGVTMVELASAYGSFANEGVHALPIAILKITDRDGNVIEKNTPHLERVLKSDIEEDIDGCLRAVTTEGTARKIGAAIEDVRGKTGTAQGDRDAWFVGYVPQQLVTAVWVGNDDNSQMRHVFGGTNCGPIFIDFMRDALKMNPKPPKSLPKAEDETQPGHKVKKHPRRPADEGDTSDTKSAERESESSKSDHIRVRLCADTGLLATPNCPSVYTESFLREDAPTERCNLHGGKSSASASGDTGESRTRHRASSEEPASDSGGESPTADESDSESRNPHTSSDDSSEGDTHRRDSASSDRAERMVTVTLCLQSGDRATRYCPDTVQRRMPASEVPGRFCTIHGPP